MAVKNLPELSLLRQILRYDPFTGDFLHLARPESMFRSKRIWASWNAAHAGRKAGAAKGGYWRLIINDRHYKAHRIAWKMHYGVEPPAELDHINGNPSDNRIANLRNATSSQNKMNQKLRSDSVTGVKGVATVWNGTFRASLRVGGRQLHIGTFRTIDEAAEARRKFAEAYYGKFARHS